MDEIDRKILSSTRRMLAGFVLDGALTGHRATEARMAARVIDFAIMRGSINAGQIDDLEARERTALADLAPILSCGDPPETARRVSDWRSGMGSRLAALAGSAEQAGLDVAKASQVARALHEYIVDFYSPVDSQIVQGSRAVYSDVTITPEDTQGTFITSEALQDYLRQHLERDDLTVVSLDIVQGGYSKSTYIVQLRTGAELSKIVIRQDRPGLPTDSSVVDEFTVLQEVHAAGVPVPRPLWIEPDTSHFGTALMAVEFSPGAPGREMPRDPAVQESWAFSFADLLARLHAIAPPQAVDVRAIVAEEIHRMRERFAALKRLPHPGVEFGIAWLLDHVEILADRPVCRTHGDLAFHNVLIHEDRVRIALDWEFTHFCDPAEDLAYVRPFIEEFGLWGRFLAEYRSRGGHPCTEPALRYFDVYNNVKVCVGIAGLLDTALLPTVDDIKLIYTGSTNLAKFEVDVLKSILRFEEASK